MSSELFGTTTSVEFDRDADDTRATVQLLVSDAGNRAAIREMLDGRFRVETGETVREADLYLVEDHLFPDYHDALRDRVEEAHPVFCPVVLIRRETTEVAQPPSDVASHEGPMLIDDVVDAPIDRSLLLRRLHSVLVRRRQSRALSSHVSTLERREQQLRRFERGVESTGNGIAMTNRLGEIEYINPAFEAMTGYAESDVLGETPRVLQPAGAADVFTAEFWQTMLDRAEWAGEVVLEHSDDTRSVVDASITAIHDEDGDVEGFVVVMADITERIQQAERVQRREEELEQLRQILTRYLRHNLRNDLNVILGYGEMLLTDETLSEGHRQEAAKIVETAHRLEEKSDTARRYSTLIQQDTELSQYDLAAIVRDSVRKLRATYPDVGFDVDVPERCDIQARTGIRDAIEELVENAAEHADAHSPRVHIRLRRSNGARLVIEDNGPGIPDLELETLAQGGETPLSHSQGIGLWLSKWLIESFDGQLSFEHLDPGTRVVVECPPPRRVGSGDLDVPTLKERERRLQTVIDRMTDAIVQVNASWEITFMDPRAEEILSISADAAQGEDLWDVFPELKGTELEAVHRAVMETRSSQHVETYYAGIDGWVSVYVYPEFDGGLSFYFRDTTERNRQQRELERARTRMELALGVTDSTVWEWDLETDAVTTHPAVHTAFGTELTSGDEFLAAIHPDDRAQVNAALERALETETPYRVEYRVEREDDVRWVEDYGELRTDDEDGSKRLIGVARDITDLKDRMRRYEAIFNQTYQFTGLLEPDGTILEANETALEFGGLSREDVVGQKLWNAHWFEVSEETRTQTKAAVERAAGGAFVRRELPVQGADDTAIIDFSIRPITDETGDVVLLVPEGRDITDLKERERQLERSRAFLERTEAIAGTGGWEIDVETGEQRWTEGTYELHDLGSDSGFDPTVDAGIEFYHPEDRPAIRDAVTRCLEHGEPYDLELQLVSATDRLKWVRTSGEPVREDGEIVAVRGAIQDITDLKERERELERAGDLFREAQALGDIGAWEYDTDGTLVWTEGTRRIHEVDAAFEPTLEDAIEFFHPDDRADIELAVQDALETGETFERELRLITERGDQRWVRTRGKLLEDEAPRTLRGFVQDITARKEQERDLERYRAITEAATDTIVAIDESSTILTVNPAVEETFGYEPDELVGDKLTVLMSDETAAQHRSAFRRYLETGERTVSWDSVELEGRHRDGTSIPLAVSFGEATFDGERFFVGTIRDVGD
jgi:PAS domain S-box-containing protein